MQRLLRHIPKRRVSPVSPRCASYTAARVLCATMFPDSSVDLQTISPNVHWPSNSYIIWYSLYLYLMWVYHYNNVAIYINTCAEVFSNH